MRQLVKWWYWFRHGIRVDNLDHTLLPATGPGKYVSVYRRGDFIDIIQHAEDRVSPPGTIRLIPCQYNHGVMVEFIDVQRNVVSRAHLNYGALWAHTIQGREVGSR